mmetsp:Transcript_23403/g.67709  ORF Transcript_23403/g.67709 Transcript_23403/m.67709 type:complete len:233 (+) Transcript_23403:253-951(+)
MTTIPTKSGLPLRLERSPTPPRWHRRAMKMLASQKGLEESQLPPRPRRSRMVSMRRPTRPVGSPPRSPPVGRTWTAEYPMSSRLTLRFEGRPVAAVKPRSCQRLKPPSGVLPPPTCREESRPRRRLEETQMMPSPHSAALQTAFRPGSRRERLPPPLVCATARPAPSRLPLRLERSPSQHPVRTPRPPLPPGRTLMTTTPTRSSLPLPIERSPIPPRQHRRAMTTLASQKSS